LFQNTAAQQRQNVDAVGCCTSLVDYNVLVFYVLQIPSSPSRNVDGALHPLSSLLEQACFEAKQFLLSSAPSKSIMFQKLKINGKAILLVTIVTGYD
jgi:hypothetical protein